MKLESTLRERPGGVHLAPIVDVILILLIFFLLGSAFMVRSGVAVTLPESQSTLEGFSGARVVTVSAGRPPEILIDGVPTSLAVIAEDLSRLPDRGAVVIRADELATHGLVMAVANQLLVAGFQVAYATAPPPSP